MGTQTRSAHHVTAPYLRDITQTIQKNLDVNEPFDVVHGGNEETLTNKRLKKNPIRDIINLSSQWEISIFIDDAPFFPY